MGRKFDFSGLMDIPYKGPDTTEFQPIPLQANEIVDTPITNGKEAVIPPISNGNEAVNDPILKGYEVIDTPKPFDETDKSKGKEESSSKPPKASPSKKEAFTDASGRRNYKTLYRIAHDFHRRHSPPTIDREYWIGRTPGIDDTPAAEQKYWEEVTEDISKTSADSGNDPFLMDLLIAVLHELDREYKRLRNRA